MKWQMKNEQQRADGSKETVCPVLMQLITE